MSRLEKSIENNCCGIARSRYGLAAIKIEIPGRRAWPDRQFFGRYNNERVLFFVEFKRPGEKPTKLQLAKHRSIKEHYDVNVYIVDSEELFVEAIQRELHT